MPVRFCVLELLTFSGCCRAPPRQPSDPLTSGSASASLQHASRPRLSIHRSRRVQDLIDIPTLKHCERATERATRPLHANEVLFFSHLFPVATTANGQAAGGTSAPPLLELSNWNVFASSRPRLSVVRPVALPWARRAIRVDRKHPQHKPCRLGNDFLRSTAHAALRDGAAYATLDRPPTPEPCLHT